MKIFVLFCESLEFQEHFFLYFFPFRSTSFSTSFVSLIGIFFVLATKVDLCDAFFKH